ncbi:MAG: tetratricopeptide repeat protein [Thermoanaerobaculia bacterium]|nr:tetratricopeptide repeat protein [Thermoanaerobaculia bacterium]
MSTVLRPLPTLELPAAFVRLWRADGSSPFASAEAEERVRGVLAGFDGVELLGQDAGGGAAAAVVPVAGRAALIDAALRLARTLLTEAEQLGALDTAALVHPGRLRREPDGIELVLDTFAEDVTRQRPQIAAGEVTLTGYAVARLRDRLETEPAGTYDPPSGRRVTLALASGPLGRVAPLHDPQILGRHPNVARPGLLTQLDEILDQPVCRLVGPLGSGKSHLLWHHLGPDGARWLSAGPDRLASPPLEERVGMDISAEHPGRWVIDVTAAGETDRAFVNEIMEVSTGLAKLSSQVAAPMSMVLVERQPSPEWDHLPTLDVPPMEDAEAERLAEELFEGFELPERLRRSILKAAAGHPLVFGQSLLRLLHRGLMRHVYGSYFYAGSEEIALEVTEQLVCEVEAEVRRLGDPLPLRLMAAVDEPISARHLLQTCGRYGITLDEDWDAPLRAAGLIHYEGSEDQLAFSCPAYGLALHQTAPEDSGRSLRHALGGVLAEHEAGWRAYRLLAGSPEALPPLLDISRDGKDTGNKGVDRDELFNALWIEHREHHARGGDVDTELEILWNLIPLAHRLGTLGRLRTELERAVELAREDSTGAQRYVALAALRAELDQEQGRYREAEQALRQALSASQGMDDKRRAALIVRLGALLTREERWGEARTVFRDLLKVAEKEKISHLAASCHHHLGHVALLQKRLDEALEHHRAAAALRDRPGRAAALASSLVALGQVALAEGDIPTSLDRFSDAEKKMDEGEVPPWQRCSLWIGRGRALRRVGDLPAAVKALRRALEVRRVGDVPEEALATLSLGQVLLEQGKVDDALAEVRKAHFQASLLSDAALLGDAERLLGRCARRQGRSDEAVTHFHEALRLHGRHQDGEALAEDHSWLLEMAMDADDADGVFEHAAELRTLVEEIRLPSSGETLDYRLFRALSWLREREVATPDPEIYLRSAYQELMRKTNFLPAERRHHFLYQVREHQQILDAATVHDLSLPYF